jgi:biopolymer transport protein ExbB
MYLFAADSEGTGSALFDFITVHWYYAIPLFLMSCVGVALVIWRLLLNINSKTSMNEFLPLFQQRLEAEGVPGALRFCKSRTDYIPSRLYAAGLENAGQGMSAVRRSMANAIELEILPDLNFLLPSILSIAKIATMVGLLVTVISMIGSFKALGAKGSEGAKQQGKEISLALFGTAMGLVTAIPLVFAHVQFKAWQAGYELKMKSAAQKLIVLLQAKQAGKSVAPPPTGAGGAVPTLTAAGPPGKIAAPAGAGAKR